VATALTEALVAIAVPVVVAMAEAFAIAVASHSHGCSCGQAVTSIVALSPAITIAKAVAVAAMPCMCFKVSSKKFQHGQNYLFCLHASRGEGEVIIFKINIMGKLKIEKYTFLSITSSIFKLQKWQTPFWNAYTIRNNIGYLWVRIKPFNVHFSATRSV
jgi:hypothetical protein